MILDGERLTLALFGAPADPRAHLVRMYPQLGEVPPLDHVVRTAAPLVARINHGVWIASCPCGAPGVPTPGCVVDFRYLLGWCSRCRNAGVGRGWRPIAAPSEAERARIEAVLLCRPTVEDRNWLPTETVADLIRQNREHGDPVPDLEPSAVGPVHGPDWRELVAPFSPLVRPMRRRLGRLLGRR